MTHRNQGVIGPITISYTGCEDAIFKPNYYEHPEYPQRAEDHPAFSKGCHASARFKELGEEVVGACPNLALATWGRCRKHVMSLKL